MKRIKSCLIVFILLSTVAVYADVIPARPYPPRLVNDFCKVLNSGENQQLENQLVRFDDSTGVQITIVTVSDLGGYSRAEYADMLGEKWGVGRKKLNNGVVILIKPSGGKKEREVHIAVGYGLESVLPDAICERIVENEMIPSFEKGNYYLGLTKSIKIIRELALGEYPPEAYKKRTSKSSLMHFLPFIIFFIIFIVLSFAKSSNTTMGSGSGKSALFWTLLMMMGNRGGGGNNSGGWGNFSGGGGSFGGFGGGSFGGGGAGGSW